MGPNKKLTEGDANLFVMYSVEINKAYERAVREALIKHKKAGNSVVVSQNGEIVTLKPEDIEVDQ